MSTELKTTKKGGLKSHVTKGIRYKFKCSKLHFLATRHPCGVYLSCKECDNDQRKKYLSFIDKKLSENEKIYSNNHDKYEPFKFNEMAKTKGDRGRLNLDAVRDPRNIYKPLVLEKNFEPILEEKEIKLEKKTVLEKKDVVKNEPCQKMNVVQDLIFAFKRAESGLKGTDMGFTQALRLAFSLYYPVKQLSFRIDPSYGNSAQAKKKRIAE